MRPFTYSTVADDEDVIATFKQALREGSIGFDTETNYNEWWKWYGAKSYKNIAGISITLSDKDVYIPLNHQLYMPEDHNANLGLVKGCLRQLVKAGTRLIGGNLKYDWHAVYRSLDVDLSGNCFTDVLLDSHIWRINSLHSVKQLGKEYVTDNADLYERLIYAWKKEAGYKKDMYDYRVLPIGLCTPYAAMDTYLAVGIDSYHKSNGFDNLFAQYSGYEHDMARHLFRTEENGIKVDIPYLEELKEQYEKEITLTENVIRVLAGRAGMNPYSNPQLMDVVYNDLKLPKQKKFDKEKQEWKISLDKMALMMLTGKHPIIEQIQKLRKITKLKGTYVDGILNNYNPHTFRMHTTYNQFVENSDSLRTGRLSSSDPLNFENIPRNDTAIRKAFLPDTEFVFCDYAGQEIRLYTHYSREPKLMRAFEMGEDVHSRTCEAVFRLEYDFIAANRKTDKEIELKREIAKRIFFGALYGAKGRRVAEILAEFGFGYDIKEGSRLIDNLYTNYPHFPKYMTSIATRIAERGYVEDVLGRRYIPKNPAVVYPVGNYLIQGTAGGMLKIDTINLAKTFGSSVFSNFIHDEIVFDRLERRSDIIEVKRIMEDWPQIKVPMIVECSYAQGSWEQKKEIKDLDAWIKQ